MDVKKKFSLYFKKINLFLITLIYIWILYYLRGIYSIIVSSPIDKFIVFLIWDVFLIILLISFSILVYKKNKLGYYGLIFLCLITSTSHIFFMFPFMNSGYFTSAIFEFISLLFKVLLVIISVLMLKSINSNTHKLKKKDLKFSKKGQFVINYFTFFLSMLGISFLLALFFSLVVDFRGMIESVIGPLISGGLEYALNYGVFLSGVGEFLLKWIVIFIFLSIMILTGKKILYSKCNPLSAFFLIPLSFIVYIISLYLVLLLPLWAYLFSREGNRFLLLVYIYIGPVLSVVFGVVYSLIIYHKKKHK